MKKVHRTAAMPTPTPPLTELPHVRDRQLLRDVAKLCVHADPEQLAALAVDVDGTLKSCAQITAFFRRYTAALRLRVIH